MSNIVRAAEIIERATRGAHTTGGRPMKMSDHTARIIAEALADEGMLTPDLPEANDPSLIHPAKGWALDAQDRPVVWTAPGGRVMIQRIEPGDLTPAQARTFALNILAAADYCEGELDATD